jgi:hypothetical protein
LDGAAVAPTHPRHAPLLVHSHSFLTVQGMLVTSFALKLAHMNTVHPQISKEPLGNGILFLLFDFETDLRMIPQIFKVVPFYLK